MKPTHLYIAYLHILYLVSNQLFTWCCVIYAIMKLSDNLNCAETNCANHARNASENTHWFGNLWTSLGTKLWRKKILEFFHKIWLTLSLPLTFHNMHEQPIFLPMQFSWIRKRSLLPDCMMQKNFDTILISVLETNTAHVCIYVLIG